MGILARHPDVIGIWNSSRSTDGTVSPPPEFINAYLLEDASSSMMPPVDVGEKPLIAVIGVGYVGLHLVTTFASKFDVVAFDLSKTRLDAVTKDLALFPSVRVTSEANEIAKATHILVSVPTTLLPNKSVNISNIRSALTTIGLYARPGATIVIESSVSVGMTRQLLGDLMKTRNLKAGMSPERVDPGRIDPPLRSIPKIISGLDDITEGSLQSIHDLYSQVFDEVVTVSKPEVAEMTKLYENCQRMVCIAYANEMADACGPHGIDPYEVCQAAATKPFGYQPFMPSLGVGGHCIPINPYYLLANSSFPLLQAATETMWKRPARLADKAMVSIGGTSSTMQSSGLRRQRVLVVGVGFKTGQSVLSCSPGVAVLTHLLGKWHVDVMFADPLVDESAILFAPKLDDTTQWNKQSLEGFDLIMVTNRQTGLDFHVLKALEGVQIEWYCM
ncbi:nucleotide sugar dehydrogenase [Plenodomus tracheiphilus IPT5]|uniref:Nucleotide sugar dehydrogenase n=1 Tax=Plenodomus tracheiphilus IPT5 TaxID=1408161 RepID=A0A6A7APM9_9PLEO|nr:nucleotide sugar dehydrogenase [Plenodomus tracheiphilus IPT5]